MGHRAYGLDAIAILIDLLPLATAPPDVMPTISIYPTVEVAKLVNVDYASNSEDGSESEEEEAEEEDKYSDEIFMDNCSTQSGDESLGGTRNEDVETESNSKDDTPPTRSKGHRDGGVHMAKTGQNPSHKGQNDSEADLSDTASYHGDPNNPPPQSDSSDNNDLEVKAINCKIYRECNDNRVTLEEGLIFRSLHHFRDVLKDYMIQEGFEVIRLKNEAN